MLQDKSDKAHSIHELRRLESEGGPYGRMDMVEVRLNNGISLKGSVTTAIGGSHPNGFLFSGSGLSRCLDFGTNPGDVLYVDVPPEKDALGLRQLLDGPRQR